MRVRNYNVDKQFIIQVLISLNVEEINEVIMFQVKFLSKNTS